MKFILLSVKEEYELHKVDEVQMGEKKEKNELHKLDEVQIGKRKRRE